MQEADEWGCPGCDYRVVTGFAQRPFSRHEDEDFAPVLARMQEKFPDSLRYDFESPEQRAKFQQAVRS